ncbi:hypothetical protein HMPREF0262_02427 [Clostridium sp. ATCC 29733]|nr:hypothetical protein HMPREF0262_02427 [Clostridium sp. ATCC 29733]
MSARLFRIYSRTGAVKATNAKRVAMLAVEVGTKAVCASARPVRIYGYIKDIIP